MVMLVMLVLLLVLFVLLVLLLLLLLLLLLMVMKHMCASQWDRRSCFCNVLLSTPHVDGRCCDWGLLA